MPQCLDDLSAEQLRKMTTRLFIELRHSQALNAKLKHENALLKRMKFWPVPGPPIRTAFCASCVKLRSANFLMSALSTCDTSKSKPARSRWIGARTVATGNSKLTRVPWKSGTKDGGLI